MGKSFQRNLPNSLPAVAVGHYFRLTETNNQIWSSGERIFCEVELLGKLVAIVFS
jgi:hypothetical protein